MADLSALVLQASINANLDGLRRGLQEGERDLARFGSGVSPSGLSTFIENASSKLASLGGRISAVGQVFAPVTNILKGTVDAASDLNESLSKVDVVFGGSAGAIKEFAETSATALGQSQQQALEAAGTFGNLFTSLKIGQAPAAEMATGLVKLASDLASFNNIDPTQALEKLRAGITGEAEPLKSLGIAMNETAMKAKALELGLKPVGGQLTEQQKITARYAIIMEQSGNAQGDFARTAEGAANAQRVFSAQLDNVSAQFGQAFLPILGQGIQILSGLITKFQELPQSAQTAITVVVGVAGALGAILPIIGGIVSGISAVLPVFSAIASAVAALNPPVLAAIAIAALLAVAWHENVGGIREAVSGLASDLKAIFDKIVAFVKAHADDFRTIWEGLKQVFSGFVSFVGNTLSGLVDVIRAILKIIQGDWSGAWELLKSAGVKIITGLIDLVIGIFNGLASILAGIWGLIRENVLSAWQGIVNFFLSIPNLLLSFLEWWGSLPAKIIGYLLELPPKVAEVFGLLAGTAIRLAGEMVIGVLEFYSQLPGRIMAFVSQAWEFVKSAFTAGVAFVIQAAGSLVSGASDVIGKLPGLISNIFGNIFTFFSGLPGILFDKAVAIGAAIWQGFKDGIGIKSPSGPEKNITAMAAGMQLLMEAAKPKLSKAAEAIGQAIESAISRYLDKVGVKTHLTIDEISKLPPAWRDRITQVVKDSEKAAEDLRRIGLVVAFFPEKASLAFDALIKKSKELRDTIVVIDADISSSALTLSANLQKSAHDIGIGHQQAIDAWLLHEQIAYESALAIARHTEEQAIRAREALVGEFDKVSQQLPESFNKIIDGILNGSGRLGNALLQLGIKVKGFIGDALGIIDAMPGRFGDATRKVVSTIDQWATFFDRILGFLHKLNSNIPDSLGSLAEKIIGIFKKSTTAVSASVKLTQQDIDKLGEEGAKSVGSLATSTQESSGKISEAFGVAASALGGFMTGLATASATGSKLLGSLTGGIQGALSGFAAGGPIGAIIGGVGGLLGGLFGGKSAAQKQKEKLELDRLKQDVQKGAQEVMQAAFQTVKQALETFDKLADFSKVPKTVIQLFFRQLQLVVTEFIALAKVWSVSMIDAGKVFPESVGPILETIGTGAEAFEKLSFFTGVPSTSIQLFGQALESAVALFIEVSDQFEKKAEKQAKKFANRALVIVETIGAGVEAFTALADYKGFAAEVFDLFAADLEMAVTKMTLIADEINKRMLKQAAIFAERAGAVVQLIKEGVEAFKGINDYKAISVLVFDLFLADLKLAVNRMQQVVTEIDTTLMSLAQAFSTKSLAIFAAIKAGTEAFNALRDYKSIPKEALDAVIGDFKVAIKLLSDVLGLALKAEGLAFAFRDSAVKIAKALADAGKALSGLTVQTSTALASGGSTNFFANGTGFSGAVIVPAPAPSTTSTSNTQHIGQVVFQITASEADSAEKIEALVSELQAALRRKGQG